MDQLVLSTKMYYCACISIRLPNQTSASEGGVMAKGEGRGIGATARERERENRVTEARPEESRGTNM